VKSIEVRVLGRQPPGDVGIRLNVLGIC